MHGNCLQVLVLLLKQPCRCEQILKCYVSFKIRNQFSIRRKIPPIAPRTDRFKESSKIEERLTNFAERRITKFSLKMISIKNGGLLIET